jgi:hypothetical protein
MKLLFTFAAAAFLASASYASAAEMPKELTGEWCPDDAAGCDPRIEGYVITLAKIMPGMGPGGPRLECFVK